MTKTEFEEIVRREGYAEAKQVNFEPLSRSEIHTHDKISFVYVLEGKFILNTADQASSYGAGETCILDKNVDHAEEAGPDGASILVARK